MLAWKTTTDKLGQALTRRRPTHWDHVRRGRRDRTPQRRGLPAVAFGDVVRRPSMWSPTRSARASSTPPCSAPRAQTHNRERVPQIMPTHMRQPRRRQGGCEVVAWRCGPAARRTIQRPLDGIGDGDQATELAVFGVSVAFELDCQLRQSLRIEVPPLTVVPHGFQRSA